MKEPGAWARNWRRSARHGVELIGFLADTAQAHSGEILLGRAYKVFPLAELPELLSRQVVDEILFAVESERLAELEDVFLLCDEEGVRTRVAVDFFPHVNSTAYLERLGAVPLLTFSAAPHDEIRLMLKRAIDVVAASVGLVVASPAMLVVALLVRLTSPGPVIFSQIRCGLNGRRFVLYKFRSMCRDAELQKAAIAHMSDKTTAFKMRRRPPAHADRPVSAQVLHRRVAAVVERAARRHVAGRTPAVGSRGSGTVPAVAAAAPPDAAGPDLPVDARRARSPRF